MAKSRTLYLVCYDIAEPHRLHRVCRFLQGYRVAGQKSVFECWLTEGERRHVMRTLPEMMQPDEDRVHIFQLDPRLKVQCYGVAEHFEGQSFLIV